jgi:GAF domain-containing protein
MQHNRETSELGLSFASLAEGLRDGRDTTEIYQTIVDSAVRVINGCDHASILVLENGHFKTAASSDDVARQIDALERETGEGPCLDAIVEESFQYDEDLTVSPTWPTLAKRCLEESPVRSMLAFRLINDGRKAGALDIFSDTPGGLDSVSIDEAAVLAAFTSVAIAAAVERSRADNLKVALDSNREIGKAIGLLMASHKLTDEQAFDVLKRASQDLNRKLHDIAAEFVAKETSERAG